MIRKRYIQPNTEVFRSTSLQILTQSGKKQPPGWAVDNYDADPGLIIPTKEETGDDEDEDGFVDID